MKTKYYIVETRQAFDHLVLTSTIYLFYILELYISSLLVVFITHVRRKRKSGHASVRSVAEL